jgi:transcriptional regulator with XRE-family HTH domain
MPMAELQKAVGARIRELRMGRGWSQEAFADICEIHRSHMGEIERGEVDVAISTLAKLAKGLDITVSTMLKGVV